MHLSSFVVLRSCKGSDFSFGFNFNYSNRQKLGVSDYQRAFDVLLSNTRKRLTYHGSFTTA